MSDMGIHETVTPSK